MRTQSVVDLPSRVRSFPADFQIRLACYTPVNKRNITRFVRFSGSGLDPLISIRASEGLLNDTWGNEVLKGAWAAFGTFPAPVLMPYIFPVL